MRKPLEAIVYVPEWQFEIYADCQKHSLECPEIEKTQHVNFTGKFKLSFSIYSFPTGPYICANVYDKNGELVDYVVDYEGGIKDTYSLGGNGYVFKVKVKKS